MTVLERSRDDVEDLADAERDFHRRYPEFDPTGAFAWLRSIEYGRLDATGTVYLDYTGGGLHGISQIDEHAELLRSTVFGNPHSSSAPSLAATSHVETARRQVLEFFHASSDDYLCVFTANASAALKLVGESYPFGPGRHALRSLPTTTTRSTGSASSPADGEHRCGTSPSGRPSFDSTDRS